MITSLQAREKKKVLETLLNGDHVLVHLTPHTPTVSLPEHLLNSLTVTLKLSTKFRGSLELQRDHIESHLLFGQAYFKCIIPYEAIWAVTSDQGQTTSWLEGLDEHLQAAIRLGTNTPSTATASDLTLKQPSDTSQQSTPEPEALKKNNPETKPTTEASPTRARPKLVRIK